MQVVFIQKYPCSLCFHLDLGSWPVTNLTNYIASRCWLYQVLSLFSCLGSHSPPSFSENMHRVLPCNFPPSHPQYRYDGLIYLNFHITTCENVNYFITRWYGSWIVIKFYQVIHRPKTDIHRKLVEKHMDDLEAREFFSIKLFGEIYHGYHLIDTPWLKLEVVLLSMKSYRLMGVLSLYY